mgnify:CR=1 FL=1
MLPVLFLGSQGVPPFTLLLTLPVPFVSGDHHSCDISSPIFWVCLSQVLIISLLSTYEYKKKKKFFTSSRTLVSLPWTCKSRILLSLLRCQERSVLLSPECCERRPRTAHHFCVIPWIGVPEEIQGAQLNLYIFVKSDSPKPVSYTHLTLPTT